ARRRRGQLPLCQALMPSGGTSQASGVAWRKRCPCWWPLLPAAALASGSPDRMAAPCVLATATCSLAVGDYPLWSCHGQ
ncbi:hypothetical protein B296_00056995, partial [Ensete ventricosum]